MDEALRYVEAGFTALKLKIGFGIDDDVTVVNAVRDAVGRTFGIMVDANHAYDRAAALEVARRIHPAGIDWFEEPLIPEDLCGWAASAASHRFPNPPAKRSSGAGASPSCCATKPPTSCSRTAARPAASPRR